jgi:hypothetical protein
MNAQPILISPLVYADDGDHATQRFTFRMRSADIKAVTDGSVYSFIRPLQKAGDLPSFGCDCSHCLAGWDCCGRMVPQYARASRIKRHLVITIHYNRNV